MTDGAHRSSLCLQMQDVSKIYCTDLLLSSRYALADLAFPWRLRRGGTLRPLRDREFIPLDGVSLAVQSGEAIGILGGRRSGKSTLAAIAAGLIDADGGTVARTRHTVLVNAITTGMRPMLTLRENLLFRAALYGLGRSAADAATLDALAFAGAEAEAERLTYNLDPLLVRNAALALALGLRPDLFIFDETLVFGGTIDERAAQLRLEAALDGRAALIIGRNARIIADYTQRCLVLDAGRIIFDGPTVEAVDLFQTLESGMDQIGEIDDDDDAFADDGDEAQNLGGALAEDLAADLATDLQRTDTTADELVYEPEPDIDPAEVRRLKKIAIRAKRERHAKKEQQRLLAVKPEKVMIDGADLLETKLRLIAQPGDQLTIHIAVKVGPAFSLSTACLGLTLSGETQPFMEHRLSIADSGAAKTARTVTINGTVTVPPLFKGQYGLMLFLPTAAAPTREKFNTVKLAVIGIYGAPTAGQGLALNFTGNADVR